MRAKYVQPVTECTKFHKNVDKTVNLITSIIHHPYSHYTSQLIFISRTHNSSFEGRDTAVPLLN